MQKKNGSELRKAAMKKNEKESDVWRVRYAARKMWGIKEMHKSGSRTTKKSGRKKKKKEKAQCMCILTSNEEIVTNMRWLNYQNKQANKRTVNYYIVREASP